MNLMQKYMTENRCYKANRKIVPKGIMVHSTATPGVMAKTWFSRWNNEKATACVHAFLDDKEVWQHLPWNHRGWHAAGAANNTHIGFEICEPKGHYYNGGSTMINYDIRANEEYFQKSYNNAIELCVMLCKQYGLTEKDILCHSEGHRKGIASNHGDVEHWFYKHNKSMNTFREDVRKALNPPVPAPPVKEEVKTFMIELEVLKRGSKGEQVKTIQRLLRMLEYKDQYGNILLIDGSFGTKTDYAIRAFQKAKGLVIDGSCGPKTWAALLK